MSISVKAGRRDNDKASASLSAKTTKGAGWIVGWRFVTRNLGLISTLALVRLLSPADFGLVALATGFIGMIDALSALGPQDAVVREPAPDRAMYDTAFTLNCLRNIVTAAIVAATAWPVAAFFSEPRLTPVLLALAAGTLVTAFENIGIVDFQRELAFHKEFQLRVSARVVGVILTITCAVLWRNYWALVVGILSSTVVRIVQGYVMSPYRPRLTLRSWRQIVGFSLWVWASSLVTMVWDKIDSVVIGRFLGTTAVGIFAIGWEIGSLPLTELVGPLSRALFSGFAEANRTGGGAARVYLRALAMVVVLTLPAGVGISLTADPLVRLTLGARWLSAVPLIQIMALAGAILAPTWVAAMLFLAEGKPRLNFHLGAVAAVIKVPLFIGFVLAFGLKGGAVAAVFAIAVQQLLYLATTSRHIGIGIGAFLRETWRSLAATAVMAGILVALGLGWRESPAGAIAAAYSLLITCLAGMFFYAAALLGIWFAQGRPKGAESDMLRLLGSGIGRRF